MERASNSDAINQAQVAAGYNLQQADQVIEHRGRVSGLDDRSSLAKLIKKSTQSYRNINVPPKAIGQQNDSNAIRFVYSAMKKIAKTIMGIHFTNKREEVEEGQLTSDEKVPRMATNTTRDPVHSMVLLVL